VAAGDSPLTAYRIVSHHLPEPCGSAAGRALLACCEGLLELGDTVRVTSWRSDPPANPAALPSWCDWRPLPAESRMLTRARALVRPRWDASRLAIDVAPDEVAIADDPESWAAVSHAPQAIATVHYVSRLDADALGLHSPQLVQDARAERFVARRASRSLAYSERVTSWVHGQGGHAHTIPIALRVPDALPPVQRPVAACLADWRWAPNQAALSTLLDLWPQVRQAVPGAELLLAGRGCEQVGSIAGVRVLGFVDSAADVLAEAAVVAFPCPPSSGPKVKVLEAVMSARVVLTTRAGVEGLSTGEGAVVATEQDFAAALVRLLREAGNEHGRGADGREAAAAVHAPGPATAARRAALHRVKNSIYT
jgi:hypothetical protein